MKKMFQEISKTDLLVVNGGWAEAYGVKCYCWCLAPDYLGGGVYDLGSAVSKEDCANKCYHNAGSDFWDYYCKRI